MASQQLMRLARKDGDKVRNGVPVERRETPCPACGYVVSEKVAWYKVRLAAGCAVIDEANPAQDAPEGWYEVCEFCYGVGLAYCDECEHYHWPDEPCCEA